MIYKYLLLPAFTFILCPTSFLLLALPLYCLFIFIMFFKTDFHLLAKGPGQYDTASCDLQALLQYKTPYIPWIQRDQYPTVMPFDATLVYIITAQCTETSLDAYQCLPKSSLNFWEKLLQLKRNPPLLVFWLVGCCCM